MLNHDFISTSNHRNKYVNTAAMVEITFTGIAAITQVKLDYSNQEFKGLQRSFMSNRATSPLNLLKSHITT